MTECDRVKAVINLENIRDNIKELKKCVPKDTKTMLIVKADGYGHGAKEIIGYVDDLADGYGVAIIDEAVTLREQGVDKMILVLSFTPEKYLKTAVQYNISQAVTDYETAKIMSDAAVELGMNAKIHIKLDTGMGRLGFACDDKGLNEICRIAKLPNIELEGLFTHFSKADEKSLDYTEKQYETYMNFSERLYSCGVDFKIRHVCNSAASIQFPKASLDMVRLGVAIYGLYPSEDIDKNMINLKPAMSIESCVSYVKHVKKGTLISYGGTYEADKDRIIATVPVGYADGYNRALSGVGKVLIHGEYAPITGRICMDQFMVDVTDIKGVKKGDRVILAGEESGKRITVEELAAPANSFNYEFVCGIGKRVPRVYQMGDDSHLIYAPRGCAGLRK